MPSIHICIFLFLLLLNVTNEYCNTHLRGYLNIHTNKIEWCGSLYQFLSLTSLFIFVYFQFYVYIKLWILCRDGLVNLFLLLYN